MCVRSLRLPALMGLLVLPLALFTLLLFTQTALAAEPPIDWPPGGDAPPMPQPGEQSDPFWSYSYGVEWKPSVFASAREGNWELYRRNFSDPEPIRLTSTPEHEARPALSPDGQWIVFDSDADRDGQREIALLRCDGGGRRTLVQEEADAWGGSWSPDGSKIVFVLSSGEATELAVVEVASGAISRLTTGSATAFDPVWLASGRILFVRMVTRNEGMLVELDPATGAETWLLDAPLRYLQRPDVGPHGDSIGFSYDANNDGWLDVGSLDGRSPRQIALAGVASPPNCHLLVDDWWLFQGPTELWGTFKLTRSCYALERDRWRIKSSVLNMGGSSGLLSVLGFGVWGFDASHDTVNLDHVPPLVAFTNISRLTHAHQSWPTVVAIDPGQYNSQWPGSYHWQRLRNGTVEDRFSSPDDGPWTVWPCEYTGARVRVMDGGENWSDWTPWAYTTGYGVLVHGPVTDNRGVPLPGLRVVMDPPALEAEIWTDLVGEYTAPLCGHETNMASLMPPGPGFAAPTPANVLSQDLNLKYYPALYPAEGLVFFDSFSGSEYTSPPNWKTPFADVVITPRGFAGTALQMTQYRLDDADGGQLANHDRTTWVRASRSRIVSSVPDHALTLSFFTSLPYGTAPDGNTFAVTLQSSEWPTPTTVYTMPIVLHPYTHRWVPIDIPIGDVVTVTLTIETKAGVAAPDRLWIDELSIGSWWTPVITDVQVGAASIAASGPITITGENFLEPVAVELSNGLETVPLPATVVGDGTLTGVVPADLPLGLLSVLVTNQAGTPLAIQTALPNVLASGPPVWLPFVSYP